MKSMTEMSTSGSVTTNMCCHLIFHIWSLDVQLRGQDQREMKASLNLLPTAGALPSDLWHQPHDPTLQHFLLPAEDSKGCWLVSRGIQGPEGSTGAVGRIGSVTDPCLSELVPSGASLMTPPSNLILCSHHSLKRSEYWIWGYKFVHLSDGMTAPRCHRNSM